MQFHMHQCKTKLILRRTKYEKKYSQTQGFYTVTLIHTLSRTQIQRYVESEMTAVFYARVCVRLTKLCRMDVLS